MTFINLDEFLELLDGKVVDATSVFKAIDECKKYNFDVDKNQ